MSEEPTLKLPSPVLEVIVALSELGGPAWLVGEGLAALRRGQRPSAFQVCSASPVASWLTRFPHAVPTRPAAGVVMIPTEAGPVDVTPALNGRDVLGDLERRYFSVHAVAWNPVEDAWLDPFGGRADADAKLLRTVGDPQTRLAEDPIWALRATRLAALHGYRLEPGLGAALRGALGQLDPTLRMRARRELVPLLLSSGAGAGIDLLRTSGLEEALVSEARPDSGAVVARLPPVLALRLAAWLRGTNASRVLAHLRFGRDLSIRVQRLLRHHPVDAACANPRRALRNLARLEDDDVAGLFALRRAERSADKETPQALSGTLPNSDADLARLEERIRAARREAATTGGAKGLALGGKQIMQLLGCGPGPQIGEALRYLTKCVAEDPSCNAEIPLRGRLERWAQQGRDSSQT